MIVNKYQLILLPAISDQHQKSWSEQHFSSGFSFSPIQYRLVFCQTCCQFSVKWRNVKLNRFSPPPFQHRSNRTSVDPESFDRGHSYWSLTCFGLVFATKCLPYNLWFWCGLERKFLWMLCQMLFAKKHANHFWWWKVLPFHLESHVWDH